MRRRRRTRAGLAVFGAAIVVLLWIAVLRDETGQIGTSPAEPPPKPAETLRPPMTDAAAGEAPEGRSDRTVRVRVVDGPGGGPIASARAEVLGGGSVGAALDPVEPGVFEIRAEDDSPVTLRVRATGYLADEIEVDFRAMDRQILLWPVQNLTLAVLKKPGGRPVAGAVVRRWSPEDGGEAAGSTRLGETGATGELALGPAALQGSTDGTRLRVSASGLMPRVFLLDRWARRQLVYMDPASRVTVRVLNPEGEPVSDVRVTAIGRTGSAPYKNLGDAAETDDSGECRLLLPAVAAVDGGFLRMEPSTREAAFARLPPAREGEVREVVMPDTGTGGVSVVGASAGAGTAVRIVTSLAAGPGGEFRDEDRILPIPGDGRVEFPVVLDTRSYLVTLVASGAALSERHVFSGEELLAFPEVRLGESRTVRLEVRDRDRHRVEGVRVMVVREGVGDAAPELRESDSSRFHALDSGGSLLVPAEPVILHVFKLGYAPAAARLPAGAESVEVVLYRSVPLVIHVEDESGQPVSGAEVEVVPTPLVPLVAGARSPPAITRALTWSGKTRKDGSVRAVVCSTRDRVRARTLEGSMCSRSLTESDLVEGSVTLHVTGKETVRVRVLDARSRPIEGALVQATVPHVSSVSEDVRIVPPGGEVDLPVPSQGGVVAPETPVSIFVFGLAHGKVELRRADLRDGMEIRAERVGTRRVVLDFAPAPRVAGTGLRYRIVSAVGGQVLLAGNARWGGKRSVSLPDDGRNLRLELRTGSGPARSISVPADARRIEVPFARQYDLRIENRSGRAACFLVFGRTTGGTWSSPWVAPGASTHLTVFQDPRGYSISDQPAGSSARAARTFKPEQQSHIIALDSRFELAR